MEKWGEALYGDPCAECGFDWSITPKAAIALVMRVPARFAELLDGQDAALKHPDLAWTAGGYVCHVADNLRSWAVRLVGAVLDGEMAVPGYDPELLARACDYNRIPPAGALWSLRHAAQQWREAMDLAMTGDVVLLHSRRGEQRPEDIARNNAHDAFHHQRDIRRTLSDGSG